MALSFEESLKKAKEAAKKKEVQLAALAADVPVVSMDVAPFVPTVAEEHGIAAYAGDEWTLDTNYLYYAEYHDDKMSYVDDEKNIRINEKQINLTQETNSQFIPFEMPRFYDGFDLKTATVLVYFVNAFGGGDYANPINMYYSQDKLKFGWLVDDRATVVAGKLNFEIQAIGVNSKGDEYIWKTKPSEDLEVLKSLSGDGVIEPDSTWVSGFLTQVTEQVALAQGYANDAAASVAVIQRHVQSAQNYASQAAESVEEAQGVVDAAKAELETSVESAVNAKVEEALLLYYTSEQIDEMIAGVDVSDQLNALKEELQEQIDSLDGLANFDVEYDGATMVFYNGDTVMKSIPINSDPTAEWTATYTAAIEEKISSGDAALDEKLSTELSAYKEATDADLASLHEDIDGLPETLQNDYYNKEVSDDKFAEKAVVTEAVTKLNSVEAVANTAKEGVDSVSAKVVEMDEALTGIDKSPRKTYDVAYNDVEDPDVGENGFVLYEIENEGLENESREIKKKFTIVGGSGGGTSTTLKIEYVTKTPLVVTTNDSAIIVYNFSGQDSSGDAVLEGTYTWKLGTTVIGTGTAVAGENTFDVTNYLTIGTQKLTLAVEDDAGSRVTKSWTVQKVDVRLESGFNDALTYPIGTVAFSYTPHGAISKVVHFVLDGKEIGTVTTSSSGIQMGYTIPVQEHGSHLLDVYVTAEISGNTITSNHVVKDILFYDADTGIPVIGCIDQDFEVRQHDTKNIIYTVHDPSTETPRVILAVDGETVSELTLDNNTQTWAFKSSDMGEHELTITCREAVKKLRAVVTELGIEIEPVTAGLAFDFNPVGYSNASTDRLWSDGDVAMTVSDNFDWVNGGYQIDGNGDSYFCIKAGTSAEINYRLFEDDAKRNGKEFKLVFKTTNVADGETTFLSCVDNTTDTNHIGVRMDAHQAYIFAQTETLPLPYSEDEIIEFEFNISTNTEDVPMVMGYEDGVSTRPLVYTDAHGFTQAKPKTIMLGSPDCDLWIYRFKVYNTSLTDSGILNNFIADARNASEMIERYDRNQIYDENMNLIPEVLAEKCPWLRIIKIEAPKFTEDKDEKVGGTTVEFIYKGGDPVLDNWIAYDVVHSGQGTSSNSYGPAGRNLDLILKTYKDYGNVPRIVLGDGTEVNKVTLTRDSVPVNYFNFKINVASSENANNALLQRRYNRFNPWKRPFVREDEALIPKIKDTMEFYNAVVFIKETDPDISKHVEFANWDYNFYGIGNIGDSKKTDDTRLTDPDDRYECILEVMDNTLPNSTMPTGYVTEDGAPVYPIDPSLWVPGNTAYDSLYADTFNEEKGETYGWRYIWEDGTDEQNTAVRAEMENKWRDFYKFVITSTNEEFKAHLGDWCVLDSVMFYYLFTLRYTMTDNHGKNSFWHYGKTGEVDAEGNPIRKFDLSFDYDNDKFCRCKTFSDIRRKSGRTDNAFEDL